MTSFFIVLSSNESVTLFENKLNSFTNNVPLDKELSNDYCVSLGNLWITRPIDTKIINVHLDILEKELGFKNDVIASFPITQGAELVNFPTGGKYVHYEPSKSEYFNLKSSKINSIKVYFTDENGKLLVIRGFGQPTLVKLRFKKIMTEQHIVHLNSKLGSEEFSDNRQTNFTNILNYPLHLKGKGWQVALANIIFPRELKPFFPTWSPELRQYNTYQMWINIEDSEGQMKLAKEYTYSESVLKDENVLKHTIYENIEEHGFDGFIITGTKIVVTDRDKHFEILMSIGLLKILGFRKAIPNPCRENRMGWKSTYVKEIFSNQIQIEIAYDDTELTTTPESMVCYCNIVEPSFWGDQKYKMLKLVPVHSKETSEFLKYIPSHLDFHSVSVNNINNIQFQLASSWGDPIVFKDESLPVDVSLLFRRKDE